MTVWNCTACSAAFAVGMPCCPQCGGTEVRENGDGPRSEITDVTGLDKVPGTEFVLSPLDTSNVREVDRSGTTSVRTIDLEGSTDGEEHESRTEHLAGGRARDGDGRPGGSADVGRAPGDGERGGGG